MTDREKLQQRIDELIAMTDKFCNEHINSEYADLCKLMIEKLGRKRSVKPLATGRLNIWAASVVYTVGKYNRLFDNLFEPYIPSSVVYEYFDVKSGTISGKSTQICQILNLQPIYDPVFTTEHAMNHSVHLVLHKMGRILRGVCKL